MISKTGQMDLSSLVQDNIDEILVKIIEFTRLRHKVISSNINNCNNPGFVPKKVDCEEFATLMSNSLSEHFKSSRLVFQDSDFVNFETDGRFSVIPKPDTKAVAVYSEDVENYIQIQKQRLGENILNNKLAVALFEQKLQKGRLAIK